MPTLTTYADFDYDTALKKAEQYRDKLKGIYAQINQNVNVPSPAPAGAGAGGAGGKGGKAAQDEASRLNAELKVTKALLNDLDLSKMGSGALTSILDGFKKIRNEAVVLRDATQGNVQEQAKYASVVIASQQAMEKLVSARRLGADAAQRDAQSSRSIEGMNASLAVAADRYTNVTKNAAEYRKELKVIADAARAVVTNPNSTNTERVSAANVARRAQAEDLRVEQTRIKSMRDQINLQEVLARQRKAEEDAALKSVRERMAYQERLNRLKAGENKGQDQQAINQAKELGTAINVLQAARAKLRLTDAEYARELQRISGIADQSLQSTTRTRQETEALVAAIRKADSELKKLNSGAGGSQDAVLKSRLTNASANRSLGQDVSGNKYGNKEYIRELEQIRVAAEAQRRALAGNEAEMQKYARIVTETTAKLKAMRESVAGAGTVFALQSVAFQSGIIGAAGLNLIKEELAASEALIQSRLTLEATSKTFNQSFEKTTTFVNDLSEQYNQDAPILNQAVSNLLKIGFNPQEAKDAIGRFADTAVGRGLDVTKAILAGSEALLSRQSRQLNTVGIPENLGPYLSKVAAQYRDLGKSFDKAAQAQALYKFLMDATVASQGRYAAGTGTLTVEVGKFNTTITKLKRESGEALAPFYISLVSTATKMATLYMGFPPLIKNTVNLGIVIATVGAITVSTAAAFIGLSFQIKRLIANEAAVVFFNTLRTSMLQTGSASLLLGNGLTKLSVGLRAAGLATLPLLLNPFTWLAVATAALVVFAKTWSDTTAEIYKNIEAGEKAASDEIRAIVGGGADGRDYEEAINQVVQYQELLGAFQQQLSEAQARSDREAVTQAETRIARTQTLIEQQKNLAREIIARVKAENGDNYANDQQAVNYQRLSDSFKTVKDKFGEFKLTGLQNSIREASKQLKALGKDIDTQVKQYNDDVANDVDVLQRRGLTPQQAQKARDELAALVPASLNDLVTRQLNTYKDDALKAEGDLNRARAELIRDGISKRRTLMQQESADIFAEYAKRIAEAQRNAQTPGLSKAQVAAFTGEAASLGDERDNKIKLAQLQADRDIQTIREERGKRLVQADRETADAQITLLKATIDQQAGEYERELSAYTGTAEERLAVAQRIGQQLLILTRQRLKLEAAEERTAIQRTYADALLNNRDLGDKKAEANRKALQKRDTGLQTVEINLNTNLAAAIEEQSKRVRDAEKDAVADWVQNELHALSKIEGAEIVSLKKRLEARLAFYTASATANPEIAKSIRDAITNVTQEAGDRARDFAEKIKEGAGDVTTLSERLDDLVQRGVGRLEKRVVDAGKPFKKLAADAGKELEGLSKSFLRLATPTPEEIKQYQNRRDLLRGIAAQSATEQGVAEKAAKVAFIQEQQDKRLAAAAKRAKDAYDSGQGSAAPYLEALAVERTLQQQRLATLKEGTAEYEKTQNRIEEIGRSEKQVADDLSNQEKARLDLARGRAELSGKMALTEQAQLNALQAQLGVLQQQYLAAQLKARSAKQSAADLLKAQQDELAAAGLVLDKQREIDAARREQALRPSEQRVSSLDFQIATTTDEGKLAALQQQRLDALISRGATLLDQSRDTKRSEMDRQAILEKRRSVLQQIYDGQRAIEAADRAKQLRPLELEQTRLDFQRSTTLDNGERLKLDAAYIESLKKSSATLLDQSKATNVSVADRISLIQKQLGVEKQIWEGERAIRAERRKEQLRPNEQTLQQLDFQIDTSTDNAARLKLQDERQAKLKESAAILLKQSKALGMDMQEQQALVTQRLAVEKQIWEGERAIAAERRKEELRPNEQALQQLDFRIDTTLEDAARLKFEDERQVKLKESSALLLEQSKALNLTLDERQGLVTQYLATEKQIWDGERAIAAERRELQLRPIEANAAQIQFGRDTALTYAERQRADQQLLSNLKERSAVLLEQATESKLSEAQRLELVKTRLGVKKQVWDGARQLLADQQAEQLRPNSEIATILEVQKATTVNADRQREIAAAQILNLKERSQILVDQAKALNLTDEQRRSLTFDRLQIEQKIWEGTRALQEEARQKAVANVESSKASLSFVAERGLTGQRIEATAGLIEMNRRLLTLKDAELQQAEREGRSTADLNRLRGERVALQGQILDGEKKIRAEQEASLKAINDMAAAMADSKLSLALTLQERQQARLGKLAAQRAELAALEQRVSNLSASGDDRGVQQALIERVKLQTQLEQGYRANLKIGMDDARKKLDLEIVRAQVEAEIRAGGQDAVVTAEKTLQSTRQRLALASDLLASSQQLKLTDTEISELNNERLTLIGQELRAVKDLEKAEYARLELNRSLQDAVRDVDRESKKKSTSPLAQSARDVNSKMLDAVENLRRAERDALPFLKKLQQGPLSEADAQTAVTRFSNLTQKIQEQRSALKALSDEYGKQLSAQDGLRSASESLNGLVRPKDQLFNEGKLVEVTEKLTEARLAYNEALKQGKEREVALTRKAFREAQMEVNKQANAPKLDFNLEVNRLNAIEKRRNDALRQASTALEKGDAEQIAQAVATLKEQEERYRKQAEFLKQNGVDVSLTGQAAVERITDAADGLGIKTDNDSVVLKAQQEAAKLQSQASLNQLSASTAFAEAVGAFQSQMKVQEKEVPLSPSEASELKIREQEARDAQTGRELGRKITEQEAQDAKIDRDVARQIRVNEADDAAKSRALYRNITKQEAADAKQSRLIDRDAAVYAANDAIKKRGIELDRLKEANKHAGELDKVQLEYAKVQLSQLKSGATTAQAATLERLEIAVKDIQAQLKGPLIVQGVDIINKYLSGLTSRLPLSGAVTPVKTAAASGNNNSRIINNNQTFTFTVNAAPGQSAQDIGRVVEGKIRELNRTAEIFGGC